MLAAFGVMFWFFSHWNLRITTSANIDYPAVFFLLLSFRLLPRHWVWSFWVLGLSLGFKQVDSILVPLFLTPAVWQYGKAASDQSALGRQHRVASTLVISSAVFLAANPGSLSQVDGVRGGPDPASHIDAASLGVMFGWSSATSRLPFFALIALVYVLFWRRKIGFYTAGLLVGALASFINFNPVLFLQYFVSLSRSSPWQPPNWLPPKRFFGVGRPSTPPPAIDRERRAGGQGSGRRDQADGVSRHVQR